MQPMVVATVRPNKKQAHTQACKKVLCLVLAEIRFFTFNTINLQND
jgi:hypothetical protein